MFSKLRRITPEEVEAAFRETGYKPHTSVFAQNKKACAIGVIGIKEGIEELNILPWVQETFHVRYYNAVSYGFYGHEELSEVTLAEDTQGISKAGFEDGQAIRKHLIQVGLMK